MVATAQSDGMVKNGYNRVISWHFLVELLAEMMEPSDNDITEMSDNDPVTKLTNKRQTNYKKQTNKRI